MNNQTDLTKTITGAILTVFSGAAVINKTNNITGNWPLIIVFLLILSLLLVVVDYLISQGFGTGSESRQHYPIDYFSVGCDIGRSISFTVFILLTGGVVQSLSHPRSIIDSSHVTQRYLGLAYGLFGLFLLTGWLWNRRNDVYQTAQHRLKTIEEFDPIQNIDIRNARTLRKAALRVFRIFLIAQYCRVQFFVFQYTFLAEAIALIVFGVNLVSGSPINSILYKDLTPTENGLYFALVKIANATLAIQLLLKTWSFWVFWAYNETKLRSVINFRKDVLPARGFNQAQVDALAKDDYDFHAEHLTIIRDGKIAGACRLNFKTPGCELPCMETAGLEVPKGRNAAEISRNFVLPEQFGVSWLLLYHAVIRLKDAGVDLIYADIVLDGPGRLKPATYQKRGFEPVGDQYVDKIYGRKCQVFKLDHDKIDKFISGLARRYDSATKVDWINLK